MRGWWLIVVYLLLAPVLPVSMGLVVTLAAVASLPIGAWAPLAVVVGVFTDVAGVSLLGVTSLVFLLIGAVTSVLRLRFEANGSLAVMAVTLIAQSGLSVWQRGTWRWWEPLLATGLVWLLANVLNQGKHGDVVYLRQ